MKGANNFGFDCISFAIIKHKFLLCFMQVESELNFRARFEAFVHGKQTGLLKTTWGGMVFSSK